MTLSTVAPTTVAELVTFLSSIVGDVNSLWAQNAATTWIVSYLDKALVAPATSFASTDVPIEIIGISADAAVNLQQITGGRKGMIKVLVADDNDITVIHNASYMVLKGAADFPMQSGDILMLVNRDGDPSTLTDGYWRELLRQVF